jgi:uncharacterized protein (DUF1330 family)
MENSSARTELFARDSCGFRGKNARYSMEVRMVAYWVARSKVNNPAQYKKYADLVPGILQKFGGTFLARGGKFKVLEGPDRFRRFVVIKFPSFEKAVACYESPEYVEAAAQRRKDGASELEIIIVEGQE